MLNTMRTTIRIRRDLLNQSRILAIKKGTSLQTIINDTLAAGFQHVTDLSLSHNSMKKIDTFRKSMLKKNISLAKLLEVSKSEQR